MIVWFFLLIPVVALLVLRIFFHKKTVFWEYALPLVLGIIVISIAKFSTEYSNTRDTEYWIEYIVSAHHYERWDEEVPCSHSYDCMCSTDSEGNECCCMTCYEHSYDVDDHPPRWEARLNTGRVISISKSLYIQLVKRFENESFKDMRRDYHSIDGDQYFTKFNNVFNNIEYIVTKHSYENRVIASHDVFNFPEVSQEEKETYGLYEYPKISNSKQPALIGVENRNIDLYLNRKNSLIGSKKQVRTFFLIYKNKDRAAAHYQKNYWKGGNKNEFIVAIGIDNDNNVTWCEPITWSESTICSIKVRDFVENMEQLDLRKAIDFSFDVIEKNFKRKEFSDFDYISIDPTPNQMMWIAIIIVILTVGVCCFVILNPFENY